eukprot:scaffold1019_cov146-Skeletonema_menzelii.AAC.7
MEAADGSGNKPTTAEAVPPSATDRPANATSASNVMSSLAGLGSSSSEDEKQKEMDVGGTVASSQKKQPSTEGDASMNSAAAVAPATSSNDSSKVKNSADGGDAMEVDQPTAPSAAAPSASITAFGLNVPKSQPLPSSPSKPQQSAKMKARGIISTLEASADSAFASKPAALPSAATMGTTGDGKKKRKEKDDKKKAVKKKGKDKVKKKKEKVKNSLDSKTKHLAKKLPTSATASTPTSSTGYSAQQAAVNDMMRRALEEDQYSALGSVVDTDSSDDEDYNPRRGVGKPILNRNTLLVAMKRHMRMEAMNTLNNFDGKSFLEDAEEYVERGGKASSSFVVNKSPTVLPDNNDEEELDVNGRRIGKRRKKKKQNRRGGGGNAFMNTPDAGIGGQGVGSGGMDDDGGAGGGIDSSAFDDDSLAEDAEISIFGQTAGSSNATWVECDRCKKWRRLRGVVDARKLPSKWYCSMNKNDPERARCSAPEEEYDAATTPESAMDQRTRKHLRLWVRRLHGNEAYENRQRKKRSGTANAKEPYEWIRCCNPSCGKWRMLLRSMDASTIMDQCKDGEWYCVMNTWDEKAASCGAAQENLPALGCPPWVMRDH